MLNQDNIHKEEILNSLDMPKTQKAGFIALIGRPSVGKSALLNALVGFQTAIVSPLPQTTRHTIKGIVNTEEGQIVFIDSPGLHKSEKRFNQFMHKQATEALQASDLILYVCDLSRIPAIEEEEIATLIKASGKKVVIALNKCDLKADKLYSNLYQKFLAHFFEGMPIINISAEKKTNLDLLQSILFENLPYDHIMYEDRELYTDQDPLFRIAEIVRGEAIKQLHDELPHSLYVDVTDPIMKGKILQVRCFIRVERESQKGIVIGKAGNTLKLIRIGSEKALKSIFPYPVHLDFMVKTDNQWRKNEQFLKKMFSH